MVDEIALLYYNSSFIILAEHVDVIRGNSEIRRRCIMHVSSSMQCLVDDPTISPDGSL